MASVYAQKMIDMMNQVGQPIVSKQTTTSTGTQNQTQSQNQGLDIGSLMMMLMLMLNKNKKPSMDYSGAADEAANAYQYMAPPKTDVVPVPNTSVAETWAPPARDLRDILPSGYPGAGTGNASPDLAEALTGAVMSNYMSRNPNMMSPGSQLSTGSNPMSRMTPAQILRLMMG